MGPCINRGNIEFSDIVNSECVDKASLIPLMNITLNSERRYSCVKRCRRLKRRKRLWDTSWVEAQQSLMSIVTKIRICYDSSPPKNENIIILIVILLIRVQYFLYVFVYK